VISGFRSGKNEIFDPLWYYAT